MGNPYMADLYVSTPMTGIVSSINARPRDDDGDGRFDEDPPDDVDGDGQILQMRVRDPRGRFRTSPRDARLLVARDPDAPGEWAVYSEGFDNDGAINEDWIGGVDLNRNFPFDWKPEWIQEGAGPYPLSEPESHAIAEFIVGHPNIGFVINGHSGPDDGLVYRPYGSRPDSAIPQGDFQIMGAFARKFAALSGGLRMLPTYVTEKSLEHAYADPVNVSLEPGPGVTVVLGERRAGLGHLRGAGFDVRRALSSGLAQERVSAAREVRWLVRAAAGGERWVDLTARAAKAGTVRRRVVLPGATADLRVGRYWWRQRAERFWRNASMPSMASSSVR